MASSASVSATEFKARCLEILDRVSRRELEKVVVTKRGKVVAVVTPPESVEEKVRQIHGFLRGSVVVPSGLDLTAPAADEPFAAEQGVLHR